MKRDLQVLTQRQHDLVIIGGGIFGICAAWDAALRGLSVALIERGDFCHATSAHCFKIVHGGIRYLQHADWVRIRESSAERNMLLRLAPHLVSPLPIVIPTYGHGLKGRELLWAGLLAYGLATWDRNRGIADPARKVPLGRSISREECLRQFPGLDPQGLTGGVIIYDGQMHSPSRLALSFLRSAIEAGAVAANYVEATGFLQSRAAEIHGVFARDILSGNDLRINAKVVVNAAGPWAENLLAQSLGHSLVPASTYSRDACFLVSRRLTAKFALAVQGRTRDPDAILSRQNRHLFLVPWRNFTLVGVWHKVYKGAPDACNLTEEELQAYINEINESYPPLQIKRDDVLMWNSGLVLFGENQPRAVHLSYGKRSRLVDHAESHGIKNLITLIGVRYTTARREAVRVVDLAIKKIGDKARPPSRLSAVFGGDIDRFDAFVRDALKQRPPALSVEATQALLRNYGSRYRDVLKYLDENPTWGETLTMSTVTKAEVVHAVREEMAHKLRDVVFRRTELGTAGHPGDAALQACADLMAAELGWNERQKQNELQDVQSYFSFHGAKNRITAVSRTGKPCLRHDATASQQEKTSPTVRQ